jgi:Photoprotection regulator fluorescence recovery protein
VVIREAKQMAGRIEQPSDLWELEGYLTRSRKEIDRMYDYRYSVLPLVFGNLIREGRLSEEELHGLADDKLAHIRSYAKLFSRLDTVA